MIILRKSIFNSFISLSIFLLLTFGLIFTSCKPTTEAPSDENQTEDSEEDTEEDTESESPSYTPVNDSDFENMTALQFTKIMGNGINLGNTMEATSGTYPGFNAEDASIYETMWGQPKTTKEMFVAMKAAGFDSVRIPVAWTNTMDWSNGDFEINENHIERVATVVNWALDADLFVMINDHWDYGWWGMFSHDEETAWKIYESIWTQVGTYFKDYDYRLVFEGGNEELGDRLNDEVSSSSDGRLTGINYSKGNLSESQCYTLAAKINQKFVDLIRSQGGKNEKRFLLIPGYNTDFEKTCNDSYKMPTDSSNTVNKLIVSVHYYDPATYALVSDPSNTWGYSNTWGTKNDIKEQNGKFYKMKKFVDSGYGVIIGEYGCALENNTTRKNGDAKWITNILDNCDKYGYAPFLWDCNSYFKKNGTKVGFIADDIAEIYSGRNYESEKSDSSSGNDIDYTPAQTIYTADSIILIPQTGDNANGVEKTITLSEAVSIAAGKKITVNFKRPVIENNYAGHILNLYNNSNNLIHSEDPDWCTAAVYPEKNNTEIKLTYTTSEEITIKSFYLYISGISENLELTEISIVIE